MPPRTRRILRIVTFACAAIGTLVWLAAVVASLAVPPGRRDGFGMVGAILATVYFVTLVLPALVLALLDRWHLVAALLGLTAVAIAFHAVVPWVPLGLIGS
ncbi:MAG: hypothetical protein FD152_3133 [Xanthobacteraceae bacterium]|nr:MAG: hypothetical protein FD152_3133 [Xanthobacteraceae bacterium]